MDIKEYGKIVSDFIENLSDEEFDALLLEAGIEKCPIKSLERTIEVKINIPKSECGTYIKSNIYINSDLENNFNTVQKVA